MNPTTPASGYTPQGQAMQSLQQALSQISGMAQGAQQDPSTGVSNAVTQVSNAQLPTNVQNVTNQLTQQSGIPALQGQQENLGQIFQMYLADQNIAQKYANPTLQSGNSPLYGNQNLNTQGSAMANLGTPNTFNDPYLSSPQALISAITGNKGPGLAFNGFSTPSQNTQEMGVVPSSAQSIINTLQSGINSQQGLVNTNVGKYQTQYGNVMDTLNNLLTNQAANAFSQQSSTSPGSKAQAGATLSSIIDNIQAARGGQGTEYDLFQYLNSHQQLLKDQGVNMNTVWNEFHSMFGKNKDQLLTGGKTKAPVTSYQLKKMPDGTLANYDKNTGKLFDPKTGKQIDVSSQQVDVANNLMSTFDNVLNTYKNMNPMEQRIPPSLASKIPALAPDMATMNTKYFLGLEPELRKLVVGGRITVQEMKWLQDAVLPTAGDTVDSYQKRIEAAKALIQKSVNASSGGGSKTSVSDPMGIL